MATLTLTHTRADGTLLDGSRKGDGVYSIVTKHGFRSFRSLRMLGLPRSRDKAADTHRINAVTAALQQAGHTVTVTIDEDTRRTFAQAEADRQERAEGRAARFAQHADNATASAEARFATVRRIGESIPFGQPILVGHHSEGRARRDAQRIDDNMRAGCAEVERAQYWADRTKAAEHYTQHRTNPATTLRRIARLEADLRKVRRWQAGQSAGGYTRALTPDTIAELGRRALELTEELQHWRGVVAQAEADGVKVWSKVDFAKGDFVQVCGRWYEVLRVNAKSVTVPGGPDFRPVVTCESRAYTWDERLPYDSVTGHMSPTEMTEYLAKGQPPTP